ncbi:MAG: hypothetical protein R3C59_04605 [Planctomycetaceae bacterium]
MEITDFGQDELSSCQQAVNGVTIAETMLGPRFQTASTAPTELILERMTRNICFFDCRSQRSRNTVMRSVPGACAGRLSLPEIRDRFNLPLDAAFSQGMYQQRHRF